MITLRKKKRKMGTGAMQMGNWSNPEQRERMRFSAVVLDSKDNSHGGMRHRERERERSPSEEEEEEYPPDRRDSWEGIAPQERRMRSNRPSSSLAKLDSSQLPTLTPSSSLKQHVHLLASSLPGGILPPQEEAAAPPTCSRRRRDHISKRNPPQEEALLTFSRRRRRRDHHWRREKCHPDIQILSSSSSSSFVNPGSDLIEEEEVPVFEHPQTVNLTFYRNLLCPVVVVQLQLLVLVLLLYSSVGTQILGASSSRGQNSSVSRFATFARASCNPNFWRSSPSLCLWLSRCVCMCRWSCWWGALVNKVCFFLLISIITSFSEEMHISRHVPLVYLAAYLPQNVSLSSCVLVCKGSLFCE